MVRWSAGVLCEVSVLLLDLLVALGEGSLYVDIKR